MFGLLSRCQLVDAYEPAVEPPHCSLPISKKLFAKGVNLDSQLAVLDELPLQARKLAQLGANSAPFPLGEPVAFGKGFGVLAHRERFDGLERRFQVL
ncbi:MAG: hypothetical protein CNCCGFBP_00014 [Fimbriimonadaceae bacterium]|nr:hypothetical protein [Fimbriimonadaceae bacterium]